MAASSSAITAASMPISKITLYLSVALLLASPDLASVAGALGELVTYWGQNADEGTLAEVCQTSLYDMVVISYLDLSGGASGGNRIFPYLNLDLHCSSADRRGCASLSTDIAMCQSMNVRVLLSIRRRSGGGGNGNGNGSEFDDGGAQTPHEAPDSVASYLWNNFLSGESAADPDQRPLGPAVLDGIDLDVDVESSNANPGAILSYYGRLAQLLRQLSLESSSSILAASPGCLFPDPILGPELSGSALESSAFDFVWVRFFDDSLCEFQATRPDDLSAILGAWEQWTSSLPEARVLLGLPASPASSASGFIPSDTLASDILPLLQSSNNYGGVMLLSDSNSTYATSIKPVV